MIDPGLNLVRLLQLADSALPVGGAAQSYGLETLITDHVLDVESLEEFLKDLVAEGGTLEAWFCRSGYKLGVAYAHGGTIEPTWSHLNAQLSALKPGREGRTASLMMGQRLLRAFTALEDIRIPPGRSHYCIAFGCIGGVLNLNPESIILAYLHQSLTGMISVCQRLLPLGQAEAMRLSWALKGQLVEAAERSQLPTPPPAFMPTVDIGSMQHAVLPVRLFMS